MAGAIFGGLLQAAAGRRQHHRRRALGRAARHASARRIRAARDRAGRRVAAARRASVVWAVKPQSFAEAAAPCARACRRRAAVVGDGRHPQRRDRARQRQRARGARDAQHAGADRPGHRRAVCARAAVGDADRREVERVLAPTGSLLWFEREERPRRGDRAVGLRPGLRRSTSSRRWSRPAREMGLAPEAGAPAGAGHLRRRGRAGRSQSSESPAVLRERVTSKGGTTHAAITSLEASGVKAAFVRRCAARRRARELGDEFGALSAAQRSARSSADAGEHARSPASGSGGRP